MRAQAAVGYDVVQAIDPASYEITRTGDGVGYARRFEDDHERLEDALEQLFPYADETTVEPGYLRVRTPADAREAPRDAREHLVSMAQTFNERHATPKPNGKGYLDALQFGETYLGIYRPGSAMDVDEFLDRVIDRDEYPEGLDVERDDPVIEWRGDVAEDVVGGSDRHIAYELCLPLAPSMYERKMGYRSDHSGFRWGDEHAERFLERAGRHFGRWSSGDVERLAIYPTHVRLTAHVGSVGTTPEQLLQGIQQRLRRCFLGAQDLDLEFGNTCYVGGLEPAADADADAWIEERGLDDVDGEPVDPEPEPDEDPMEADAGGGGWQALNPFGGS